MLDPSLTVPMIRYNTKDVVEMLPYNRLADILRDFGQEALIPTFALPMGIIWGKYTPFRSDSGTDVYVESVKECLYADHELANIITGNFRLVNAPNVVRLLVQIRENKSPGPGQGDALAERLRDRASVETLVSMIPYREFPYGMAHDFQRKNQYV